MTTQFIITVLFLIVSHGMEGKNLELLIGKYNIPKHFDDDYVDGHAEIKLYPKALVRKLDFSDDPVPAVIVRNNKGMAEKIGYISKKNFKAKIETVMAIGTKDYKLDRIVQKDDKPQLLVWKDVWGKEVVFTTSSGDMKPSSTITQTKEFAEWQKKIVSCLSKKPEGMFLSNLGHALKGVERPREFEIPGGLLKAIELIPCVSIRHIQSKRSHLYAQHVILTGCPANEPDTSQKVKVLKAQQDTVYNFDSCENCSETTKLLAKEQNPFLKEVNTEDKDEENLFGELLSDLRHGTKIYRERSK